jgi:CRP-like cAMP-binding protein
MGVQKETIENRPLNDLLQRLSRKDFILLEPHLVIQNIGSHEILYNPGDVVDDVCFPCDRSLVSFVISMEDGRKVQAALVGREGAVGGIVSRGSQPAHSHIVVKTAGPFARIPVEVMERARRKSSPLHNLLSRYADCLFAYAMQSIACNAVHSIEQRAAKWISSTIERSIEDTISLTHEELASMLGVGRSYASRVIQALKLAGTLETRRGAIVVRDRTALQQKSCLCDVWIRKRFDEALGLQFKPS